LGIYHNSRVSQGLSSQARVTRKFSARGAGQIYYDVPLPLTPPQSNILPSAVTVRSVRSSPNAQPARSAGSNVTSISRPATTHWTCPDPELFNTLSHKRTTVARTKVF